LALPKPGTLDVIVDDPPATPVTGTLALVAPAVNVTVAGTVATPVLLELKLAVNPADAGPDKFNVRFCVLPALTVRLPGEKKLLPPPAGVTVTSAVAFGMPVALAVIVADPAATPVTGTVTLLAFAPKFTNAGTMTVPGLLELRLTVNPLAKAGDDRFSVRFCVVSPMIVKLAGEKLIVTLGIPPEVTCTGPLAGVKPVADAVMMADPMLPPLTVTRVEPATSCGMKMSVGFTVTLEVLLLLSVMKTPPDGAGFAKFTG
jgi:hypothetical protein